MATPSFTHLFSLPEEIIDILCQRFCPCCSKRTSPQYFFRDKKSTLTQDRKCLSALSLTCKELRRISQPHLYHRPIGRDLFGFIDTIGRIPTLGQHVKELCLSRVVCQRFVYQHGDPLDLFAKCDKRYRTHLYDAAQRNPMVPVDRLRNARSFFGETIENAEIAIDCLLSVVVSFIPNVNELEICVQTDRKFWSISSGYLPNLKKLLITVSNCFPADNLDSLAGLLDAAPQLESIELAGLDLREAIKESERGLCHNNVNEIILRSSAIHTSRLEAIMRGFSKLQTFRFGAPEYWSGAGAASARPGVSYKIEDILMLRSDTLKHVTLEFPGWGIDGELVIQDLSGMKVLETLYIDNGILHRRWQQGLQPARRICQILPESIKEFGLIGAHVHWYMARLWSQSPSRPTHFLS
ncbi:aromatic aminotransferase [Fusarium acutatum]|uniref:Aromatic aminotransferase n=1 Tax=Fusarium acutatum TaxID=78861 RepID=A0A8H4JJF9_9HYPO|nr:aromatic aminotransferase [Fusarium acutatum]